MARPLKIFLIALAGVLALLAAAAAYFAATFDPNDYKGLVIERVRQERQRALAIPGAVRLSFFPRIGIETGAVSLSERNAAATFASFESARVSLAFWPLLQRRLVVDRITLRGMQANVTRFEDGRTSIDDLLGGPAAPSNAPPPTAGTPLQFDVAGIAINDAALAFDDRPAKRRIALTKASLQTGRIAPGVASEVEFRGHLASNAPRLDADLSLAGRLLLDPAKKRYAFQKLEAKLDGQALSFSDARLQAQGDADVTLEPLRIALDGLEVEAQARQGQAQLTAKLQTPQLSVGDTEVRASKLALQLAMKEGTRELRAQLALPAFSGAAPAFTVPALSGEASLDDGPLHAKAKLAGGLAGDVERQQFAATQWTLALEGQQGATQIRGTVTLGWSADFKTHVFTLPRLDIDATLPNPAGGALALQAKGNASARLDKPAADGRLAGRLDQSQFSVDFGLTRFSPAAWRFDAEIDQIDADRYRSRAAAANAGAAGAEKPLDLSALRDLDLTGTLRVGALKVANLRASQLRLDLRAAGGKLQLDPIAANLYQGSVAGRATLVAAKTPQFQIEQTLSGISVGPLLQDGMGKAPLEGRGNVSLNVATQGATTHALLKALNGTARLALRDGAVKGINIAQAVRGAKAKLGLGGGAQTGTGSASEGTDFSELGASFRIAGGVAHNDDLDAKSPLLRVGGQGDIDLGESRLDYLVKATVVGTLQGQGGPELQALRGQTIPVRLKGPFDHIGYSIDLQSLARELATQKLEEKLGDKLGNKGKLEDEAKKRLGDKLKGLIR